MRHKANGYRRLYTKKRQEKTLHLSVLLVAAALFVPTLARARADRPDKPAKAVVKQKKAKAPGFRFNHPRSWVHFRPVVEIGFIAPIKHTIQFGRDTTKFDYVGDGGQNNLFFLHRWAASFVLFRRHHIKFVYQPLDVRTSAKVARDTTIGTVTFPAGTPVNMRYGFDFYRLTYLYQFLDRWGWELAVGAGMQIRNARITFTSADGALRYTNGNIGPVPLLSVRARYNFNSRIWLETEIDGFYANLKYVNGGDTPVEGAILDASLRVGFNINRFTETFVNIRYLGGGARGESDIYTDNWLHTMTVTVGVGLK